MSGLIWLRRRFGRGCRVRSELWAGSRRIGERRIGGAVKFLLWCILLVICWPLALLALILYPLVWLILLPFRIVGIAVDGVLELLKGILFLPGRILRGPRTA